MAAGRMRARCFPVNDWSLHSFNYPMKPQPFSPVRLDPFHLAVQVLRCIRRPPFATAHESEVALGHAELAQAGSAHGLGEGPLAGVALCGEVLARREGAEQNDEAGWIQKLFHFSPLGIQVPSQKVRLDPPTLHNSVSNHRT